MIVLRKSKRLLWSDRKLQNDRARRRFTIILCRSPKTELRWIQGWGKRKNKAKALTKNEEEEPRGHGKLGRTTPGILINTMWWLCIISTKKLTNHSARMTVVNKLKKHNVERSCIVIVYSSMITIKESNEMYLQRSCEEMTCSLGHRLLHTSQVRPSIQKTIPFRILPPASRSWSPSEPQCLYKDATKARIRG